jgi:hypothetical protein
VFASAVASGQTLNKPVRAISLEIRGGGVYTLARVEYESTQEVSYPKFNYTHKIQKENPHATVTVAKKETYRWGSKPSISGVVGIN